MEVVSRSDGNSSVVSIGFSAIYRWSEGVDQATNYSTQKCTSKKVPDTGMMNVIDELPIGKTVT